MVLTGYYIQTNQVQEDDYFRAWVKEHFKIDLQMSYVAGENYDDKVRTMAAADQLPDLLQTWSRPLFDELAKNGQLLAWDDLFANYVPAASTWIPSGIQDMFRYTDGKLYYFTGLNLPMDNKEEQKKYYSINGPSTCAFANQDILKAANMQPPTTPDELYAYLKAAVALPATNGGKIIGLESTIFSPSAYTNTGYPGSLPERTFGVLVHMFGQFQSNYTAEPDDANQVMKFVQDNPAYLKAVKFAARLYREGLMDKDAFTLNNDDINSKIKQNRVAYAINIINIEGNNTAISQDPNKPYEAVQWTKDPSVQNGYFNGVNPIGGWYFAASKNVKDPERLAKYLEWHLSDEGLMFDNYGPPDESKQRNTWYYDMTAKPDNGLNLPGKPVLDLDLQKQWDTEKPRWEPNECGTWGANAFGLRSQMNYCQPGEFGVNMATDMWQNIDKIQNNDSDLYWPADLKMIKFWSAPFGDVFTQKGPKLDDLLNKWEVKMIVQSKDDADVDSMYAQMMQEAKKAGYDEIAKEAYQIYQNVNK